MSLKQPRTSQGRERILQEAEDLFAKHGFEAVSIRDIAQATGLSHGAIYHHFQGKEDLFWSLVETMAQELVDSLHETNIAHQHEPARQRIAALTGVYIEFARDRISFSSLRELRHLHPERLQPLLMKVKSGIFAELGMVFKDGIANHEIRELDVEKACTVLLGMINSMFATRAFFGGNIVDGDFIVQLYFEGIAQH